MPHQILVIDDDVDVVRFLARRLQSSGYGVLLAHDGIAGEAAARKHRPDLILLDMRMPCRDGLATLAALRSTPETAAIPVVMLSGIGADGTSAIAAGANDVLLKPCGRNTLLETIQPLLGTCPTSTPERPRSPQPAGAAASQI